MDAQTQVERIATKIERLSLETSGIDIDPSLEDFRVRLKEWRRMSAQLHTVILEASQLNGEDVISENRLDCMCSIS